MASNKGIQKTFLVSDSGFNIFCCNNDSKNKEINISIITAAAGASKDTSKEASSFNRLLVPLPPERLFRHSQRAFHERQLEFKVQAGHITPQVASLFKAIGKTMPVAWQGKDTIMVMDEVIIQSPYESAQLAAKKGNEEGDVVLLNRVQRLLEHERQKLFINK
jgi:hypothetical protein